VVLALIHISESEGLLPSPLTPLTETGVRVHFRQPRNQSQREKVQPDPSFGFLSQGGDPPPTMPDSVIERHRDIAIAMLLVGLIFILTSMCLAGRSYAEAKVRSLLTMAVVIIPAITAVVSLY
jgi:hypothetical protein